MKVEDVREHPLNPNAIEVKVKVPMKGVTGGALQWLEPNMREVRVKYRVDPRRPETWKGLIGRTLRIRELEVQAQKLGYRIAKARKVCK